MSNDELEELLRTLPDDVVQGRLTRTELRSRLVILLQAVHDHQLPGQVVVATFIDLLNKNLSQDLGDTLQIALLEVSIDVEDDRSVHYWRGLIDSNDRLQRDNARYELFRLVARGNELATTLLREYLGEEPTEQAYRRLQGTYRHNPRQIRPRDSWEDLRRDSPDQYLQIKTYIVKRMRTAQFDDRVFTIAQQLYTEALHGEGVTLAPEEQRRWLRDVLKELLQGMLTRL